MTTLPEELPIRAEVQRGNWVLLYSGTDSRGTVLSQHRVVGPAQDRPGLYQDPLGGAVLRLLQLYERVRRERDEALELLAAEPSERPRKKRGPENGLIKG